MVMRQSPTRLTLQQVVKLQKMANDSGLSGYDILGSIPRKQSHPSQTLRKSNEFAKKSNDSSCYIDVGSQRARNMQSMMPNQRNTIQL